MNERKRNHIYIFRERNEVTGTLGMKEHTNKRSEWELEIAWTAVGNKG